MPPKTYRIVAHKYSRICKTTGLVLSSINLCDQYHWAKQVGDVCEHKHPSYKYNLRYDGVVK
jgi:hypothetical protein